MNGLTKRQKEIFNFIQTFIASKNYSPSYREIMQQFGFSSPATVYQHIRVLKRKGVLNTEKKCSRSLLPLSKADDSIAVDIPFIGHLIGKKPIEKFSKLQTLTLPRSFVPFSLEKMFLLKVQGDFLNEELIANGDLILIEKREEIYNGEPVLVLMNQQECYIKRYHNDGNRQVRLESYLSYHQPICLKAENVVILGAVVRLFRFF